MVNLPVAEIASDATGKPISTVISSPFHTRGDYRNTTVENSLSTSQELDSSTFIPQASTIFAQTDKVESQKADGQQILHKKDS